MNYIIVKKVCVSYSNKPGTCVGRKISGGCWWWLVGRQGPKLGGTCWRMLGHNILHPDSSAACISVGRSVKDHGDVSACHCSSLSGVDHN